MWVYRSDAAQTEELAPAAVEAQLARLRHRIAARYLECASLTDPELLALSTELDRLIVKLLNAKRSRRA